MKTNSQQNLFRDSDQGKAGKEEKEGKYYLKSLLSSGESVEERDPLTGVLQVSRNLPQSSGFYMQARPALALAELLFKINRRRGGFSKSQALLFFLTALRHLSYPLFYL